jgi:CRP/FNR family transcriptional regulator, cyclic AMP receptor protein
VHPDPQRGGERPQGRQHSAAGRLLDLDPELGEDLDPERFQLARRHLLVHLGRVRAGTWRPAAGAFAAQGGAGLLIVEGLALRQVRLHRRQVAELLGAGDLLRPWQDDGEHAHFPFDASLEVVEGLLLAVLDRSFVARAAAFPEVSGALYGRAMARARSLAGTFAISQLRRAEHQVLIKLWHLADRFGRVGPDGVRLPLPLTHAMLATLLGMHRPAVTTALGALKDQGLVLAQDVGWLLLGEPPEDAIALGARGGLVRPMTGAAPERPGGPTRLPGS